MRRFNHHRRAVALSLVFAASIAAPTLAASPEPAPATTIPTTLTWQRLPDDPKFVGKFAPKLSGVAALPDGSIVALGVRDPMVIALESGLGSNVGSWVLPAGGTAWTSASLEGEVAQQNVSLADGTTGLVAVSDHGVTWASADGLTWAPAKVPDSAMIDVVATDTGFAAVDFAPGAPALWTSVDGVAWTATKLGKVGGGGTATQVAHKPGVGYLMGGSTVSSEPLLWSSVDGTTWKAGTVPVHAKKKHTTVVTDIAAGPAGFLLLIGDYTSKGATASVWTSPDGEAWQQVAKHDGWLTTAIVVGDGFLAAGSGVVLSSPDGVTWTTTPEPLLDGYVIAALSVAPDGRVIAAGYVPNGPGASQAAVWVGTPEAGGPVQVVSSPAAPTSPEPSPSSAATTSAPTAAACLDKKAYDLISEGLDVPDSLRAQFLPPVADALATYDPSNDPRFKGVAKFLVLRDRLVGEIRRMALGDMSRAEKTYVDLMTLLYNHSVRVCK